MNAPASVIPAIAELQRDVLPGVCCFCEEPISAARLGARRRPLHCAGPECERSYHRLYRRRRTERLWSEGLTAKGTAPMKKFGYHLAEVST